MEKINLQKLANEAKGIVDPVKRADALAEAINKWADFAGNNKNNRWNNLFYILVVIGLVYSVWTSTANTNRIDEKSEKKQGTIDAGNSVMIQVYKDLYQQEKADKLQEKHEKDSVSKAKAISDSILIAQKVIIIQQTKSLEYWTNKK